jgi:hypothetical protein
MRSIEHGGYCGRIELQMIANPNERAGRDSLRTKPLASISLNPLALDRAGIIASYSKVIERALKHRRPK